jgi:hypothetical protein
MRIEDIDAAIVGDFLAHVESERAVIVPAAAMLVLP